MGLTLTQVVRQGNLTSFTIELNIGQSDHDRKDKRMYENLVIQNRIRLVTQARNHYCAKKCEALGKGTLFVCFTKNSDEDQNYQMEFTCEKLNLLKQLYNLGSWYRIGEIRDKYNVVLEVSVKILPELCSPILPVTASMRTLWHDTVLTDFELRCKDGRVFFHRSILAAVSPVFYKHLIDPTRGKKFAEITTPGVSRFTLQQLKNFLYLNEAPKKGLKPLLCISAKYQIMKLEVLCAQTIADDITSCTVWENMAFAVTNKSSKLTTAILYLIQDCSLQVADVEKCLERAFYKPLSVTDVRTECVCGQTKYCRQPIKHDKEK